MIICNEFWHEFMRWAVPMYKIKPDSDVYDVFNWLRMQQPGSSPYSESFMAKIDMEVEKEIRHESKAA